MPKSIVPEKPPKSLIGKNFFVSLPPDYDPGRRLVAAVVVRAIRDYFEPGGDVTAGEWGTAEIFLRSEDCKSVLVELGIPVFKVNMFQDYLR